MNIMRFLTKWLPVLLTALFLSNYSVAVLAQGQGNGKGKAVAATKSNGKGQGLAKKSADDDSGTPGALLQDPDEATDSGTGTTSDDSSSGEDDSTSGDGDSTDTVNSVTNSGNGKVKGKGNGLNKVRPLNGNNDNASDGVKGRIVTNKDIVYTGEPLEISLHFAQGAHLIQDGDADAFMVIFAPKTENDDSTEPTGEEGSTEPAGEEGSSTESPQAGDSLALEEDPPADEPGSMGDAIVLPVSDEASTEITKLFEIPEVDLSGIDAGTYQLGLILTIPGGDPLVVNDWYNGFLGLVDIVGLTVSAEAVESDEDGDGMMDCEPDIEGLSCSDDTSTSQ